MSFRFADPGAVEGTEHSQRKLAEYISMLVSFSILIPKIATDLGFLGNNP